MFRILSLALIGLLSSCSLTASGKAMGKLAPEINATLTGGEIVLAPGDTLMVRFPHLGDWDQDSIVVMADGTASFLSLDDIRVAGMTLESLDGLLTVEYAKILAQPELTVQATQTAPRVVFIMGEVNSPGSFPIPADGLTLIEAFGLASGFIRDTAKLDHTLLVRWIPEENRIRTWKIDASVDEWDAREPVALQAHDVIFVPARPIVHINDWVDRYIRRNIPFPYLVAP